MFGVLDPAYAHFTEIKITIVAVRALVSLYSWVQAEALLATFTATIQAKYTITLPLVFVKTIIGVLNEFNASVLLLGLVRVSVQCSCFVTSFLLQFIIDLICLRQYGIHFELNKRAGMYHLHLDLFFEWSHTPELFVRYLS